MAVVDIPMTTLVGDWNQRTTLDGTVFGFRFIWNDRDETWYFDLFDEDGNRLRSGVRVVPNFIALYRYVSVDRPAGVFFPYDSRPDPQPPLLDELGVELLFAYQEGG